MENHHAINGKTNYFYGHFPVRYVSHDQRVNLLRMGRVAPTSHSSPPFPWNRPRLAVLAVLAALVACHQGRGAHNLTFCCLEESLGNTGKWIFDKFQKSRVFIRCLIDFRHKIMKPQKLCVYTVDIYHILRKWVQHIPTCSNHDKSTAAHLILSLSSESIVTCNHHPIFRDNEKQNQQAGMIDVYPTTRYKPHMISDRIPMRHTNNVIQYNIV